MILLTPGNTDLMIVTLNEFRTLDAGSFLFVFTHIETRDEVKVLYNMLDDQSDFQDRYNQFEIDTSTIFSGYHPGFWNYDIYEQASLVNTDETGLTRLENGIMKLLRVPEFEFTKYQEATSFKVYNG